MNRHHLAIAARGPPGTEKGHLITIVIEPHKARQLAHNGTRALLELLLVLDHDHFLIRKYAGHHAIVANYFPATLFQRGNAFRNDAIGNAMNDP